MKVVLTGPSARLFEKDELELNSGFQSLNEIKDYLISNRSALDNYHMCFAVNSELAEANRKIGKEDCILVFHPFAGG